MAIKINGVEITSNKLNNVDILVERLNGTVVYSKTLTLQWQFVGQFSSEPYNFDLLIASDINGQYKQGIQYLDINYPNFEFYKATLGDYEQANVKLSVTVPEGAGEMDVMNAFMTQHTQWYVEYVVDWGSWNYAVNNIALRADDGTSYSYWKLRPAGDYYEGFVIVIADQSTLNYFEYVVAAVAV